MALRELTQEERDAARKKALAARVERADIKKGFGAGTLSFEQVLIAAARSEAVARLKVLELLESLPGVGRVTATRILEQAHVSVNRRLGGLGVNQRKTLAEHLTQLA